jgi:hypothetical protein
LISADVSEIGIPSLYASFESVFAWNLATFDDEAFVCAFSDENLFVIGLDVEDETPPSIGSAPESHQTFIPTGVELTMLDVHCGTDGLAALFEIRLNAQAWMSFP